MDGILRNRPEMHIQIVAHDFGWPDVDKATFEYIKENCEDGLSEGIKGSKLPHFAPENSDCAGVFLYVTVKAE